MKRATWILSTLALFANGPAMAGPINVSTGLDSSGNVISTGGVIDANWTVTTDSVFDPTGTAQTVFPGDADGPFFHGGWINNNHFSNWIARDANTSDNGPAPYTFTRTFDVTSFKLSTVKLSGFWTLDDAGTLSLNGNTISTLGVGSWTSLNSFTAPNSDFVPGLNTLTMTITASDQLFEGVRLQGFVSGSPAAVAEPTSLTLFGMTCLGFFGWRRRQRKSA
jgi:hypothetical protein